MSNNEIQSTTELDVSNVSQGEGSTGASPIKQVAIEVYDATARPTYETWPLERVVLSDALRQVVPADPAARRVLVEVYRGKGCMDDPVYVTPKGLLVDGYGRYDAAKELGFSEIAVLVRHDWAERTENELCLESLTINATSRRNLSVAQWVRVGRRIEAILAEDTSVRGRLREAVAERIRVISENTYDHGKKVQEEGEAGRAPVAELCDLGLVRTDLAYKIVNAKVHLATQKKAVSEILDFPADWTPKEKRVEASKLLNKILKDHKKKQSEKKAEAEAKKRADEEASPVGPDDPIDPEDPTSDNDETGSGEGAKPEPKSGDPSDDSGEDDDGLEEIASVFSVIRENAGPLREALQQATLFDAKDVRRAVPKADRLALLHTLERARDFMDDLIQTITEAGERAA